MLQGLIMGLLATIFGEIRFAAMLRRCRVDKDTLKRCSIDELIASGKYFSHKGKLYNREKYISERRAMLEGLGTKQLQEMADSTRKCIDKGVKVELNQVELEAVTGLYYAQNGLSYPKLKNSSNAAPATSSKVTTVPSKEKASSEINNAKATEKSGDAEETKSISTKAKQNHSNVEPIDMPFSDNTDSVFCHKCGFKLVEDSAFCSKCGEKVPSVCTVANGHTVNTDSVVKEEHVQSKLSRNRVESKQPSKLVCKRCGTEMDKDSKRCSKCGKKRNGVLKTLLISLLVLLLVGIIATAGYVGHAYSMYSKGIEAMNDKDYAQAKELFDDTGGIISLFSKDYQKDYDFVSAGILYEQGIEAMNRQDFIAAKQYFDSSVIDNSSFSNNYQQEYDYVSAGVLYENGEYVKALREFKKLKSYDIPASIIKDTNSKIYSEARILYKQGRYSEANMMFSEISGYLQAGDYLTLISFHLYPSGGEYMDLVKLMGFEDANSLLVSDQSIATKFLAGRWTELNVKWPAYFSMQQNGDIEYTLPFFDAEGYYFIDEGVLSVGNTMPTAKDMFRISVLDYNSISVYCYKDASYHTLYRE